MSTSQRSQRPILSLSGPSSSRQHIIDLDKGKRVIQVRELMEHNAKTVNTWKTLVNSLKSLADSEVLLLNEYLFIYFTLKY